MKRKIMIVVFVGLAAVLSFVITATPSSAKPNYDSLCAGCHIADSNVTASVTEVSSGVTFATYNFKVSGPYSGPIGYGVFDSNGTKVVSGDSASGTFTVAKGSSYNFYGVNKDPSSMRGYAVVSLNPPPPATPTPLAPTPTPVPPTATPKPTVTPSLLLRILGKVEEPKHENPILGLVLPPAQERDDEAVPTEEDNHQADNHREDSHNDRKPEPNGGKGKGRGKGKGGD